MKFVKGQIICLYDVNNCRVKVMKLKPKSIWSWAVLVNNVSGEKVSYMIQPGYCELIIGKYFVFL